MRRILAAWICALSIGLTSNLARAQQEQHGTPVQGDVIARSTVNGSATITTGNSFQQILPSIIGVSGNAGMRQSLTIQNNNASDSCWLFIGAGTASKATSILLATGQAYTRYWPYVPSDAIQATCATSSDTLYVDNQ